MINPIIMNVEAIILGDVTWKIARENFSQKLVRRFEYQACPVFFRASSAAKELARALQAVSISAREFKRPKTRRLSFRSIGPTLSTPPSLKVIMQSEQMCVSRF
jgi:hypothetical protein